MYTDIHSHILYGTDDGPKTKEEMLQMLEASYADGVRDLCVTPHFNFVFYGDNTLKYNKAFEELLRESAVRFPDMHLYRGNEIFYHEACIEYLKENVCQRINGSKYVLVDFTSIESKYAIIEAIKKLLGYGYLPILAHAERYVSFGHSTSVPEYLREIGAVIQINAASLIGKNGLRQKLLSNKLVKRGICSIVCSDSHNCSDRATYINDAFLHLERKFGTQIAQQLTRFNAMRILNNERI